MPRGGPSVCHETYVKFISQVKEERPEVWAYEAHIGHNLWKRIRDGKIQNTEQMTPAEVVVAVPKSYISGRIKLISSHNNIYIYLNQFRCTLIQIRCH